MSQQVPVFRVLSATGGRGIKYSQVDVERLSGEERAGEPLQREWMFFPVGSASSCEITLREVPSTEYSSVRLEVKGVPFKSIQEGSLIVPRGCGFVASRRMYALCEREKKVQKALGVFHTAFGDYPASFWPLEHSDKLLIVQTRVPFVGFPLMDCICETAGSPLLVCKAFVMGNIARAEEIQLGKAVSRLPKDASEERLLEAAFDVLGLIRAPIGVEFPATLRVGSFILAENRARAYMKRIERLARREGGMPVEEISRSLGVELELCKELVKSLESKGFLVRKGKFILSSRVDTESLSPFGKGILARLKQADCTGLPLSALSNSSETVERLSRMGLVVVLDHWLVLERSAYDRLVQSLTLGAKSGDTLTLEEAKGRTGLSRRYILDILKRLEENGIMERKGDLRIFR